MNIEKEKRTTAQNNALHQFFTDISETLNNSHISVQMTLKPTVDLEWTPVLVKEILWRIPQEKMLGKRSTTELNKLEDINLIYDVINRFLAKHGLHVQFPEDTNKQNI